MRSRSSGERSNGPKVKTKPKQASRGIDAQKSAIAGLKLIMKKRNLSWKEKRSGGAALRRTGEDATRMLAKKAEGTEKTGKTFRDTFKLRARRRIREKRNKKKKGKEI